jgi:hypothetical protein
MTFDRFMSLKKQQSSFRTRIESPRNVKIYTVIFSIFSVVLHFPNILLFEIKEKKIFNPNSSFTIDYYDLDLSEIAVRNRKLLQSLYKLHIALNGFNLILMIFLSILTIIYIRRNCDKLFTELRLITINQHAKLIENDRILTRLKLLESKTNKMILYMSVIFIVNELMLSIGYITEFFFRSVEMSIITKWICIIVTVAFITNLSCNTLLYLKYSKPFYKKFK